MLKTYKFKHHSEPRGNFCNFAWVIADKNGMNCSPSAPAFHSSTEHSLHFLRSPSYLSAYWSKRSLLPGPSNLSKPIGSERLLPGSPTQVLFDGIVGFKSRFSWRSSCKRCAGGELTTPTLGWPWYDPIGEETVELGRSGWGDLDSWHDI